MIAIIDYGLSNMDSIKNALDKLNIPCVLTSDATVINNAEALILPGVGAASQGMNNLRDMKLDKVIIEQVSKGKPLLGICLGMQLLFSFSEEGNVKCLNILGGSVKKFNSNVKVPQIGWNRVKKIKNSHLFNSISQKNYFYFVHSYYCEPVDSAIIAGTTEYGDEYASVVIKDTIFGAQFHPEKSGKDGFQLLQNFINSI